MTRSYRDYIFGVTRRCFRHFQDAETSKKRSQVSPAVLTQTGRREDLHMKRWGTSIYHVQWMYCSVCLLSSAFKLYFHMWRGDQCFLFVWGFNRFWPVICKWCQTVFLYKKGELLSCKQEMSEKTCKNKVISCVAQKRRILAPFFWLFLSHKYQEVHVDELNLFIKMFSIHIFPTFLHKTGWKDTDLFALRWLSVCRSSSLDTTL